MHRLYFICHEFELRFYMDIMYVKYILHYSLQIEMTNVPKVFISIFEWGVEHIA